MTRSRAPRLLRGALAASVATFVALLSHVAAGGGMPGWLGVFVPWVLALAVSTVLAGKTLSVVRLALAVAISQALFHLLFTVGTVTVDTGSRNAFHDHDLAGATGPVSHLAHADAGMWIAHIAAAALTVAALHRGERAVRRLLALSREIVQAVARRILVVLAAPAVRADVARSRHPEPLVPVRTGHHPTDAVRRGPPLLTV